MLFRSTDELPVLVGKSPLEAYEAFFRSFADEFKDLLGSTITVRRIHEKGQIFF